MTKKTKSYSSWRNEKLLDSEKAARYLNAAERDSKEAFLHALTNVIQVRQVSALAKDAGVTRESLYRSFSDTGNPTLDTFRNVLGALGLRINIVPEGAPASRGTAPLTTVEKTHGGYAAVTIAIRQFTQVDSEGPAREYMHSAVVPSASLAAYPNLLVVSAANWAAPPLQGEPLRITDGTLPWMPPVSGTANQPIPTFS